MSGGNVGVEPCQQASRRFSLRSRQASSVAPKVGSRRSTSSQLSVRCLDGLPAVCPYSIPQPCAGSDGRPRPSETAMPVMGDYIVDCTPLRLDGARPARSAGLHQGRNVGGQRAPDRKRRALHQAEIGARAGPIWHYVALRGTRSTPTL